MIARLAFGLQNTEGEVWYSSEYWIEGFEVPPLFCSGMVLRFDTPIQDNDGRWSRVREHYCCDGSDPLRATIKSFEGHVSETMSSVPFVHVELEVEGDHTEEEKLKKLIEFHEYLIKIKRAEKTGVSDSESGFSEKISHFLQRKNCATVADVANMPLTSFHKKEKWMVDKIEEILKERWGLMFSAGAGWLTYSGQVSRRRK